jgi:hypothetical protein
MITLVIIIVIVIVIEFDHPAFGWMSGRYC